jgi:hypothetical protein
MKRFLRIAAALAAPMAGVPGLGSTGAAAADTPIACGFGNVALMLRTVRAIECTVGRSVKVTGAALNGGACEDPVTFMSRANLEGRRSGAPDFMALRDFRKTYVEGDKFIVAVPKDCDLTSFTISIEGYDLTWPVR